MIAMLSGEVLYHGVGFILLRVDSVGYKINLPEDVAHGMNGNITLYTHEVIRENQREFFGFTSVLALELFWKLTNVSGVGPKSGQKIVFAGKIEEVKAKIMKGDLTFLMSVPGIGKKTAQKIILELKGALADEPEYMEVDQDAVSALVSLGYSKRDAEEVLSGIEADSTEGLIRAALKGIGK